MELTILEQCCLRTAPVRTNLLLSGLFEIHPQDTIPNVLIHQILPYLLVFKGKTHHIYISNSMSDTSISGTNTLGQNSPYLHSKIPCRMLLSQVHIQTTHATGLGGNKIRRGHTSKGYRAHNSFSAITWRFSVRLTY